MKLNVIPVPSLSTMGWISDVSGKIDRLMAYFYSNYADQSLLFSEMILSAAAIHGLTGGLTADMIEKHEVELRQYLSQYFASVTVEVSAIDNGDGRDILKVIISASDGTLENKISEYRYDYSNGAFQAVTASLNA